MKKISGALLGILFFFVFALQVSAQSILKDGKIPKDLVITLGLSSTIHFSVQYDYKITSDGKVFLEYRARGLPAPPHPSILLNSKSKLKKKKLKDRLSKTQLRQIIREFEKSGFFEMNEYYQGDPTFKELVCINHADTRSLSILANGKVKNVAFFLSCSYGADSPLHSFLNLCNKIEKELNDIKKEELKISSKENL